MPNANTKRKCAPESLKTRRAREKLLKSFQEQDAQITQEALKLTVEKIHKWIADHNDKRVLIKDKPIQLFAQNQNAAEISKKVKELALTLQQSLAITLSELPKTKQSQGEIIGMAPAAT